MRGFRSDSVRKQIKKIEKHIRKIVIFGSFRNMDISGMHKKIKLILKDGGNLKLTIAKHRIVGICWCNGITWLNQFIGSMVAKDIQRLTSTPWSPPWILSGCERSNMVTSGNHVKRNTGHVDKQRQRFSCTGRNLLKSCGSFTVLTILIVLVVIADDNVSDSVGDDDDNDDYDYSDAR